MLNKQHRSFYCARIYLCVFTKMIHDFMRAWDGIIVSPFPPNEAREGITVLSFPPNETWEGIIVSSLHQNDFSLMVQSIMKIIFKYHNLLPLICVQVETTHTYNSNSWPYSVSLRFPKICSLQFLDQ